MTLMVQDLTNPMLAQIPHVLLAAHAGTIMGVETNAMQFYPEASPPRGRASTRASTGGSDGRIDLSTVRGPGFGYRARRDQTRSPPPRPTAASYSLLDLSPTVSPRLAVDKRRQRPYRGPHS